MDPCHVLKLGLMEYLQAWELQKSLAQQVSKGIRPNTLLVLEHPPVYTIGRRGRREHILLDQDQMAAMGVSLYEVDRGGQATCHGPGQLVAYPIVNLRPWGGPLKYVRALEQVMIRTLADYDIEAGLLDGLTGAWVGQEKIGSIGIKISRSVSHHGLALNVNTNLDLYRHIVPCGVLNKGVTSMERLLGEPLDLALVAYTLQYHFGRLMGFRMVEEDASPEGLPAGTEPALR